MPTTNRDTIGAAIMAALADLAPDGELIRFRDVERRLPSGATYWSTTEALTELWERGDVECMKINGSPHVRLPDDLDRAAEAARRRAGRPRRLLTLGAA